jgi:hypothetical protein
LEFTLRFTLVSIIQDERVIYNLWKRKTACVI